MPPSTASTFYLKSGDTLPEIHSVLRDGAGTPVALTLTDLVTVRYKLHNGNQPLVEEDAEIVDPDAPEGDANRGAVFYKLPADTDLPPGDYDVEWTVLFSSGDEATFPNRGYDVLTVGKRLS